LRVEVENGKGKAEVFAVDCVIETGACSLEPVDVVLHKEALLPVEQFQVTIEDLRRQRVIQGDWLVVVPGEQFCRQACRFRLFGEGLQGRDDRRRQVRRGGLHANGCQKHYPQQYFFHRCPASSSRRALRPGAKSVSLFSFSGTFPANHNPC